MTNKSGRSPHDIPASAEHLYSQQADSQWFKPLEKMPAPSRKERVTSSPEEKMLFPGEPAAGKAADTRLKNLKNQRVRKNSLVVEWRIKSDDIYGTKTYTWGSAGHHFTLRYNSDRKRAEIRWSYRGKFRHHAEGEDPTKAMAEMRKRRAFFHDPSFSWWTLGDVFPRVYMVFSGEEPPQGKYPHTYTMAARNLPGQWWPVVKRPNTPEPGPRFWENSVPTAERTSDPTPPSVGVLEPKPPKRPAPSFYRRRKNGDVVLNATPESEEPNGTYSLASRIVPDAAPARSEPKQAHKKTVEQINRSMGD